MSSRYPFHTTAISIFIFLLITAPTISSLCMNNTLNDGVNELTAPWGFFWTHDDIGEYSSDSNCSVLIAPTGSVPSITINFTAVETEMFDIATLYAGIDTSGDIIATISGIDTSTVIVPNSAAFFNFKSDGTLNRDGIMAFYYVTDRYEEIVWEEVECPFDCYGRGRCEMGQCICDEGYIGALCKNDDNKKLFQLYENCQGDSWTYQDETLRWDPSFHDSICYFENSTDLYDSGDYYNMAIWEGIRCAYNRVTNIALTPLSLNCTPKGLPNDTLPRYLETLDLHDTLITGEIPDLLFRSTTMTQLNLANTGLVGEIPKGVAWGSGLNILDLSHNSLTGPVPDEIAYLRQITELNLENNHFFGFVPEGFTHLTRAQILLRNNEFFCPIPSIPQIDPSATCINITVEGVYPSSAVTSGGSKVTAKGAFHSHATMSCVFGEVESPDTSIIDEGTIECLVPEHVAGVTQFVMKVFGRKVGGEGLPFLFQMDCSPGTYLSGGNKTLCLPCPDYAICEGGKSPPYPQYGYHKAVSAEKYLPCFIPSACPSDPSGSCTPGFTGSRCSQCEPGLFLSGEECITCSGADKAKPLGLIVFGILGLSVFGIWMAATALNFSSANLLLLMIQVSGLILKIPMSWSATLTPISTIFIRANVDLVSLGITCAFHLTFDEWMTLLLLTPLAFFGVILLMCLGLGILTYVRREKWFVGSVRGVVDMTVNAFSALMIIGHIPIAEQFVAVFECVTDVDRSYMLSDPQVSCYTDEWYNARNKAIVGCILYAGGIPFTVFVISTYYRNRLNDPVVLRRYGILFDLYRDSTWWFEGYRTLYSLLLMVIPVMLADYPSMIATVNLIVVNLDKFLVQKVRPFRFPRANNVYPLVVWTFNTLTIAGILFYSKALNANQAQSISIFTFLVIITTFFTLLHGLIFEWQLLFWHKLARLPIAGPIVTSSIWRTLFPIRLTPQGIEEARKLEKLPALARLVEADDYPPAFYERVLPTVIACRSTPRLRQKEEKLEREEFNEQKNSVKKTASFHLEELTEEHPGLHRRYHDGGDMVVMEDCEKGTGKCDGKEDGGSQLYPDLHGC